MSAVFLRTCAVAMALLIGGCASPAPVVTPEVPGGVPLVASGTSFVQKSVEVHADQAFSIVFENRDGEPHNVSISAPDGRAQVFVGETITGPAAKVYAVPALPAGAYTFRCDVHPEMKGTLVSS
ncbi:MAG: cupredoxin domain-containing protein [Candidatus Limnocylindrales bacterium]